jgi:DNA-binding response OmpR family regulator
MVAPDVSIAVVNNEPALLEALKFNLERSGYRVQAYGNSADALDALIAFPADLVITDGSNSPFDGVELFRRLREHTNVPVIFVSAWALSALPAARSDRRV